MSSRQLLRLRFDQIFAGLTLVSGRVSAAGLSVNPFKTTVSQAADRFGPQALPADVLGSSGSGSEGTAELPVAVTVSARQTVLDLHIRMLDTLTAADPTVGKGYGLGRALADLTLRPTESTADAFQHDFAGRGDTIKGWLHDLKTVLPDHAVTAVRMSLNYWQEWVQQSSPDDPLWTTPAGWSDPVHPLSTQSIVTQTLATQGNRWRAVLTGEKQATDMLSPDELVVASEALLQRVGSICRRFWTQYRIGIVGGLAVLAGVVAVLIAIPSGTGGGLGALGAIIAASGLTWKGLGSTLGTAIRKAEPSLWGAEIDQVVTAAITVLPGPAAVTLTVPTATGLSRVKRPPHLDLTPEDPAEQKDRPPIRRRVRVFSQRRAAR